MPTKITTEIFLARCKNRTDHGNFYDYSKVEYKNLESKIEIICPIHGSFFQLPGDHIRSHGCKKCGRMSAKETCLEIYGAENPFQSKEIKDKIKESNLLKYGVENPSQDATVKAKKKLTSSIDYEAKIVSKLQKRKETCLEKYGVESPMQHPDIAKKAVDVKISKGGFTKSNSSKEATNFIHSYLISKGYSIDQCAFADTNLGLHEWGTYASGRWILYDLVVFENGYRGDKNHIIEILEYHGPFHYTEKDAAIRPNDKAYPWNSNNTTILESVLRDQEKESIAKQFTSNYNVVWNNKESK